ncbi:MAG: hypothetical protein CBR30_08480 [Dictyoglomus sp. NZ13-RE01]|nr:MAG: hypothetical protein CBR30_08480 [Dictyoglomus sp. NZ13-RE01]
MRKNKTVKRIWEVLNSEDNFLLVTHKNPDGDAVGSILGLYYFLLERNKKVDLYIPGGIPYFYQFLAVENLSTFDCNKSYNVAVFLDCGDVERIGENNGFIEKIPLIINIDHHPTNTYFGNINLVDPSASSVTEILTNLILKFDKNISEKTAECFLTGLITDTGSFRFSNTTINSLKTAIKLMEKGANISYISKEVYEKKSLSSLKLLGTALVRLRSEDGIAYSFISQEDMIENNAKIEDIEGIIDVIRTLRESKIAVLFYPISSQTTKVSLRSKSQSIDVGSIAKSHGGGGHKEAAGFEKLGKPEDVSKEIIQELKEYIKRNESFLISK